MEGIISTYPILVGSVVGTVLSILFSIKEDTRIFSGPFNKDVDTELFIAKKHSPGKYYYTMNHMYYIIGYCFAGFYNFFDVIKHLLTHFLLKNNPTIFTYTLTSHIISYFIHYILVDDKSINFENLALHLLYAICYVLGGKSVWIPIISESVQNIFGVVLYLKMESDRIKRIIFKRDDIPSKITEEDYNKICPSN